MDPDAEVDFDFSPFLIRYKSGRVRRLKGTSRVGAGTDAATGVVSKDVVIDAGAGLAARLYVPSGVLSKPEKLQLLVYFHGGAFAVHSAFSGAHFRFLNALVSAARVVAVSVDYRLAPEHPVPAAYDDAWDALGWAVAACAGSSASGPEEPWLDEHGDALRLFVAGDSAGANIAHNVAMRAGRSGLPGGAQIEGLVLLHPYFRGKELVPSEGADPMFLQRVERSWAFVCAGRYGIDHPFINPSVMPAEEWAALGCRRALVTVAELDTMRDRGRRYVEALRASPWAGEEAATRPKARGMSTLSINRAAATRRPRRWRPSFRSSSKAKVGSISVSFIKRSFCCQALDRCGMQDSYFARTIPASPKLCCVLCLWTCDSKPNR